MKISERILQEAFLSARPGQLDRLSAIAAEVERLEALARRVEEAQTVTVSDWMLEEIPPEMDGQRVAIVPVDDGAGERGDS